MAVQLDFRRQRALPRSPQTPQVDPGLSPWTTVNLHREILSRPMVSSKNQSTPPPSASM
ncbi:hypothetical protein PMIN07_002650 [Paraphaeosphaeria minitans]